MNSLVTEPPYLPLMGMNPDGNGLSIDPSECVWLNNLRPLPGGLQPRSGFTATNTFFVPPAFEAFHHYVGSQVDFPKLFGFSRHSIWELFSGQFSDWVPSGVRNFYPSGPTSASGGSFENPAEGHYAVYEAKVFEEDFTSPVALHFVPTAGDTLLFLADVEQLEVDYSTGPNEIFQGELRGSWYIFHIPVPTGKTIDFLISSASSVNFYGCWSLKYQMDCSFFSSTQVFDFEGIKLVVAGSNPPAHGESESDETTRVLLEYTTAAGWTYKTTYELFSVGRENTAVAGHGTNVFSDTTIPDEMTAGDEIYPGLFTFFTLTKGEIGRASSLPDSGGANKYRVFSNDGYLNETTSWVGEDGKWSLQYSSIGGSTFGTETIYIAYSFKTPVSFKPRHVQFFNGYLLMGNTVEDNFYLTWRSRNSYPSDSSLFHENDFYDFLDYGLETIEALVSLGASLFAYTREGLHRGFIENTTMLFKSFWQGGVVSGRTVAQYNNIHFFLGPNDVYIFDGSAVRSVSQASGHTRIKETFSSMLDQSKYLQSFAFFNETEKEFWLFIPTVETPYPTKAFVYSLDRDSWACFEFGEVRGAGFFAKESNATWTGLGTASWESLQQSWNDLGTTATQRSPLLSLSDGAVLIEPAIHSERIILMDLVTKTPGASDIVLQDSDETDYYCNYSPEIQVPWYLITRDFVYGSLERKDRTLLVDFEAVGSEITLSCQGDFSLDPSSFEQAGTIPLGSTFLKKSYFPDFYDYAVRFLLQGVGFIKLRWIQPQAKVFRHKGEV
jgi:hypothetical protein